jgi:hypothetical protein
MNSLRNTLFLEICTAAIAASAAHGQNTINWNSTNGNWNSAPLWDSGNLPDTTFDEIANISNGGTVLVNSALPASPGQVVIGQNAGQSGTLNIASGGQLAVTFTDGNTSNGGIAVGAAGRGTLTVQPGGSLSARTLSAGGEAGSNVTLGGAAGGAATVNIEFGATFGRGLRVIGPNVNFATQSLTFQATSVYTPQITAATHSPLKTTNIAALAGTLRPEFTNGVVPAVGSTWNLIDAPAFSGQFTIDASAAPVLPLGQVYRFNQVPSAQSVNGFFGQLAVDQLLVLNVNRGTGAMSIATGPASVSIDGYKISSAQGGLAPANWTSLQDQAVSDWRESPAGGSVNQIAELKPTASTAIVTGAQRNLGNVFRYPTPTQFGVELEDIAFEYYKPDGSVTQGIINYSGEKEFNNLVLSIDPTTGAGRIENQSTLSVNIDGYKISSTSGSLLPGPGGWNSLDDQNVAGGDWRESNPTANQLVELKPDGSTAMTGGITFNLGSPFKAAAAGGLQDLKFEYLFPGDTAFRLGEVVYRPPALRADFNDDLRVNAADLAIFKPAFGVNANGDADGDGDTDGTDFLIFQRELGANLNPAAAAASVAPEPAGTVLFVVAGIALVAGRRRSVVGA